jgi:hypothetical protein
MCGKFYKNHISSAIGQVGATSDESEVPVQLQRIVSRCKCEFFYTTFGETGVDKIPSGIPDIPPAPKDLELWDEINKPVEAFTLMHDELNVFTNSLQVFYFNPY